MLSNWIGHFYLSLLPLAFCGGLLGAALGPLLSFSFTGILVLLGELLLISGAELNLTRHVAFGVILGPHVCFGGGVAALAYASKYHLDEDLYDGLSNFDLHPAKEVTVGLGSRWDVLAVGGVFGVIGYLITQFLRTYSIPTDPVAGGVVLSAFLHRYAFGYTVFGIPGLDSDVLPEDYETWLPYQNRWLDVGFLSVGMGMLGAYMTYLTGSAFFGFGLSTAFLLFLCAGVDNIPVTHHMTLPAGTAVLCYLGIESMQLTPGGMQSVINLPVVLVLGGIFGLVGGYGGEISQRLFYRGAETHLDPPAAGIVISTFIIAVLSMSGVFAGPSWIPSPL